MSFISLTFLVFFSISYLIYWNLSNQKKPLFLIFLSSVFYISFSFKFFIHILFVIGLNYLCVRFLKEKKYFLPTAISINLINLIFFKYFYFLLEILGYLLEIEVLKSKNLSNQWIANSLHLSSFSIFLPLTISYYTFQFISLHVDIHRKEIKEKVTLYQIFSYILFFPIMIAGPILRFKEIIFQFQSPHLSPEKMSHSLWLILIGIVKKALLASSLATILFPVFQEPTSFSSGALFFSIYLFAFYLYLDFSGLIDLARGTAGLLGFHLPINFKAPLFMSSFGDLWRRWHLTFSYWIRDYIYIPLGGSRRGKLRVCLNLIVTFSLGGLWHGASLNFFIWGFLTGFYLSVERNLREFLGFSSFLGSIFYRIIVWFFYGISWIFFFSPDFEKAKIIFIKIFSFSEGLSLGNSELLFYIIIFVFLFHIFEENEAKIKMKENFKKYSLPLAAFIVLLFLIQFSAVNQDFFYANF